MQNNNLEGCVTFKNKPILIVSYDKQGQMVMKEMSWLGYFFSNAEKNKNTKNKILAIAIAGLFVFMFADDFIRGLKNFPERFVSALEISRACDNGRSGCQYNSRIN
jgi:hypothetical protein